MRRFSIRVGHSAFDPSYDSIARALEALRDDTVIDGEIIAYGDDGRPSFNVLQNHRGAGAELYLYAFDLLKLGGTDLDSGSDRPATVRFCVLT